MNSVNDDLTPPDVSLDPAAKAHVRQRVLAGLEEPATVRRWWVPAGAVAAVAADLPGFAATFAAALGAAVSFVLAPYPHAAPTALSSAAAAAAASGC